MNTSQQAVDRCSLAFGRDDKYPWRVIVRGMKPDGDWKVLEIFEWSEELGAHEAGRASSADYVETFETVHYYVGEVAAEDDAEPEDVDHQTARWDHDRDLRKHEG